MCFCVALIHNVSFIFTIYHSQSDGALMFDWKLFFPFDHLSSSIHICGDFNFHYEMYLVHLSKSNEGKYCHDFSIAYKLTWAYSDSLYRYTPWKSSKPLPHHLSWWMFCSNVTSLGHFRLLTALCQDWCQIKGVFWCSSS